MVDVETVVRFVLGVVGLILGARLLVQGASKLAATMGVPPLVIGLTVVAFGTGSPELAVTLRAAWSGTPADADLGVGNVVGSNIANILLVLGASAMLTPLVVRRRLVGWDVPAMILASVLLLALGWDGSLSRLDGTILFSGIVLYSIASIVQGRRATARDRAEAAEALAAEGMAAKPVHGAGQVALQFVLIVVGLAILVVGADQLVEAAKTFARALGVSELVIGLTVVAIGTSLPEAATSIIAGLRGEREIALGNAVGSNLFNILAVLGVAGLITPQGVPVSSQALRFDIPVMIAVAVACLPVVFTGAKIARWEGVLFLSYYLLYTGFLYLRSEQHELIEEFSLVMIAFVLPMTALGLVLTMVLAVRSGKTTGAIRRRKRAEKAGGGPKS